MRFLLFSVTFLFSGLITVVGQHIKVDTMQAAQDLILKEFLQGGVTIKNIRYSGAKRAIGHFECFTDSFPIKEGILLTTGDAASIEGPNFNIEKTGVNDFPGDMTLTAIAQGRTFDACVVEFDFIPASENIAFDYIFASEEYPEYVNSAFNDVFAFMVSRVDSFQTFNIAFLPGTKEPITVNNVNHLKNAKFFIENPAPSILNLIKHGLVKMPDTRNRKDDNKSDYVRDQIQCKTFLCKLIQYDGFTRMLTAKAKVVPGKVYHFKIAIADVKDDILDSGVLLRAHSFRSYNKYGQIEGDTSGYLVQDDDVIPLPEKEIVKKENHTEIPSAVRKTSLSESVLFEFDSSELTDSVRNKLDLFYSEITDNKLHQSLKIAGHTDDRGSDGYNSNLSRERALSVKNYLVKKGFPSDKISVEFFGEKKNISTNLSESGRSQNRRVEISAH
jgi:outer membrane protein OmpA-like peptidoglycan-associated protein